MDIVKLGLPQIYYVPSRPLADLRYSLPIHDGVQRQFQRPVFSDDSSLEYPRLAGDTTPPDDIDGFQRDQDNPWLFHPVWLECAVRAEGTKLKPNGCIDVVMACNNPAAPTFMKPVKCATCQTCVFRLTRPSTETNDQDQPRSQ